VQQSARPGNALDASKPPQDNELCTFCRAAWVNAVGHIEYSDYYEKRWNQTMGTAGLILGQTAMLVNGSMDLWMPGPVAMKVSTFGDK
jgi:hypothetical protein